MLTVTPAAKAYLAENEPERPVRLIVGSDEAIEFRPDEKREDDLTFSHIGQPLLLVDSQLAVDLDGKALATERDGLETRVVLVDRHAQDTPLV